MRNCLFLRNETFLGPKMQYKSLTKSVIEFLLNFVWWQAFKGKCKRLLFQSSEQLWLCSKNPFLDIFWYKLTCFIFFISSVCRAFLSHLLRAVSTRSTLFEKYISVFSVKTLKTTYCLRNCSIPNALDMQKVGGENHNCALFLDFVALFFVIPHACPYFLE